jgi:hypothetical protein
LNSPSLIFKSLVLITSVLCMPSCKDKKGGLGEGSIEFTSKGTDENHPFYGLTPNTATLKFKGDKFALEMSTIGIFNTSIIGDLKEKTLAQTVRFLNLKQACLENEIDIRNDNKDYELKIEETNETKKIAGLKCHKIKVTMVKNPEVQFDAWYTKELGVENCNSLNPYHEVKGMLMDYRVKKMGLELHFVATEVNQVQIPDKTFEIPTSLKIITKGEMKKFFDDLQ